MNLDYQKALTPSFQNPMQGSSLDESDDENLFFTPRSSPPVFQGRTIESVTSNVRIPSPPVPSKFPLKRPSELASRKIDAVGSNKLSQDKRREIIPYLSFAVIETDPLKIILDIRGEKRIKTGTLTNLAAENKRRNQSIEVELKSGKKETVSPEELSKVANDFISALENYFGKKYIQGCLSQEERDEIIRSRLSGPKIKEVISCLYPRVIKAICNEVDQKNTKLVSEFCELDEKFALRTKSTDYKKVVHQAESLLGRSKELRKKLEFCKESGTKFTSLGFPFYKEIEREQAFLIRLVNKTTHSLGSLISEAHRMHHVFNELGLTTEVWHGLPLSKEEAADIIDEHDIIQQTWSDIRN